MICATEVTSSKGERDTTTSEQSINSNQLLFQILGVADRFITLVLCADTCRPPELKAISAEGNGEFTYKAETYSPS